jgi:FlaA1/EpsC-like NDP-sugar epimerase
MSLLMLKSVLTTLAVVVAVGQTVSGLRMRGRLKVLPLPPGALRLWHRMGGDAVLLLTLSVAFICVTHLSYTGYSARVPLHAALGTLAAAILIIKVVIARRFRRFLRRAGAYGAAAGLSLLGCFLASALWYFVLVWWKEATVDTRKTVLFLILAGLVIAGLAVACGGAQEEPAAPPPAEEPAAGLSGEELLQARCTQCHGLDPVEAASKTEAEWESTVERMISKGAELTDAEAQILVDHLAETYGP